jgi:hypothetical protein
LWDVFIINCVEQLQTLPNKSFFFISDWVFGNVWSCSTLFIMKTFHKSDELKKSKKKGGSTNWVPMVNPCGEFVCNRHYKIIRWWFFCGILKVLWRFTFVKSISQKRIQFNQGVVVRGVSRGGARNTSKMFAPPSAIRKNKIFWRKIVIFHTKYPKNFRASLRSAQFFLSTPPPLAWICPWLWLWSYGSWIYNYLCHQCLSPLKLWIRVISKLPNSEQSSKGKVKTHINSI